MTHSSDALERAGELLGQASERRALGWRALALTFYEPAPDWVEMIQSGLLLEHLQQATGWLDRDRERFSGLLGRLSELTNEYAAREPDELLRGLTVEYARLFIGPEHVPVPPYESVYRDIDPSSGKPVVNGPTTIAVKSLYQRHGLRSREEHRDLPDHVATELEFLYFLCRKEAEAWRSGDLDEAKEMRRAQQTFLAEHLGRWWPSFFERLVAAKPANVYQILGEFGTAYLGVETGVAYADGLSEIYPTAPGTGGPPATVQADGPTKALD